MGSPYRAGDLIWLHCPAIPRGHSRKFHRPWQGPFEVIEVISDVVYRVRRYSSPRQRLVVHFNRLKPYNGQPCREEPTLVDHLPNTTPTPMYSHSPGPVLPENDSSSDRDTGHLVSSDTEHAENEQSPEENDNDTLGNTEAILPRRFTRQRRPPDRYGDFVSH